MLRLQADNAAMGKISFLTIIITISLLISSCMAKEAPVSVPPTTSIDLPELSVLVTATQTLMRDTLTTITPRPQPSSTPLIEPTTMSGEFVISNTSAAGLNVEIEWMAIILEYRNSTSKHWEMIDLDCSLEPPVPVVLKTELVVQYECQVKNQLPPNAIFRTAAEVKIFNSEEIFRIELEMP